MYVKILQSPDFYAKAILKHKLPVYQIKQEKK